MSDNPMTSKLENYAAAVKEAERAANRAKTLRDAADVKVQKAAETFKAARADADAKQADLDAATLAVTKATSALRAEQRNVS